MSYITIDHILNRWATSRDFKWAKFYQDYPVRSIDLVNLLGNKYQLWIDEPDDAGNILVHVWDFKKRRKDYSIESSQLDGVLNQAHQQVRDWMDEDIRTHKPTNSTT